MTSRNLTLLSSELPFTCASVASGLEPTGTSNSISVNSSMDKTTFVSPSKPSSANVSSRVSDNSMSTQSNTDNKCVHQRPKSAGSKARRKLPEPTPEMIAAHVKKQSKPPVPLPPPKLEKEESQDPHKGRDYATIIIPEKKLTSAASKSVESPKTQRQKLRQRSCAETGLRRTPPKGKGHEGKTKSYRYSAYRLRRPDDVASI